MVLDRAGRTRCEDSYPVKLNRVADCTASLSSVVGARSRSSHLATAPIRSTA